MWQLLFNGLGVMGSLASLHSYVRSFSGDKNVAQIQKSLQHLEQLHTQLLESSRVNQGILDEISPAISDFPKINTRTELLLSATALEGFVRSVQKELAEE